MAIAAAVTAVLALVAAPPATAAPTEGGPTVELSLQDVAKGTEVTVAGTGWRPRTLLMLLVCGQNMIGGTNTCANADGRAVTTDAAGRFGKQLPIVAPPKPCPCVVHVATVTGGTESADAPVKITDHPVAALPSATGSPRLAVLAAARLEGDDGILTWFGAPPERELVVTVGNLGAAPVTDPVFQVGTAHGVFAPLYEERRWKGTIKPGGKARVALHVALDAGASGDYTVFLKYGEKTLVTQPWGVDRPYGVTLFWILLCVVVPAGLFRIGMAVVDRVRPRGGGTYAAPAPYADGPAATGPAGRRRAPADDGAAAVTAKLPRVPGPPARRAARDTRTTTAVLPWFTPDTAPGARPAPSAPSAPSAPTEPERSAPPAPPAPPKPSASPAQSAPPAPAQTSAPSENRSTTKGQS
ncbi:neocarzinostatin apoprotein domain-containing protein [Streptomyces sp. NPDC093225]|uniref:neocarzinostatin apoprotein domain-containing protein n=1 Tax=Streptomyces sp. NPDC093225 TaxID=3366034 RepID=UPI0037F47FFA